jgi:2'-hydroxyisoflavone reductase
MGFVADDFDLKARWRMDRRLFISAASGALIAAANGARGADAPAVRPLRILILGGTQFLGVHITERAIARGHTVTLFNRGRTHADLFPKIEKLQGDRDDKLDALKGRSWDAVVDDSGYVPRHVKLSAQLLAPVVRQYLFVSSISAYATFSRANDEGSPLGKLADQSIEKVNGDTYGPLKALCEKTAESLLPGRLTVIRPGYVVGPNDHTDRFTYWPARAARGGEMLVAGTPDDAIQFIDVRDLARFTIEALERRHFGTFNLVTPPGKFTMGQLISACVASAAEQAHPRPAPAPTWVPAEFITRHDATLLDEFPIWVPATGDSAGFAKISDARALHAGLHITPLEQTVHDTLAWHLSRPEAERAQLKAGLPPQREQAMLAAWHQSRTGQAAG